jgi:hypothetical protein
MSAQRWGLGWEGWHAYRRGFATTLRADLRQLSVCRAFHLDRGPARGDNSLALNRGESALPDRIAELVPFVSFLQ